MVKIEEYNLSGYKNISNAQLTFNNFNVIIGPNNSGKSNFIQSISFLNFIINSSTDELTDYFEHGFGSTHFGEIANKSKVYNSFLDTLSDKISFELKISNSDTNRIFEYFLEIDWTIDLLDVSYKIAREHLTVKEASTPGKASYIFDRNGNSVKYGAEFSKTSLLEVAPDSFSIIRLIKLIANEKQEEYQDAVSSLNSVIKSPIFYFSNTELLKPNSKDRLSEFNGRTVAYNLENEIISIEEKKDNWEIFKTAIRNILNITNADIFRYSIQENESSKKGKEIKHLTFSHLGFSKSVIDLSDGSILILAIIAKILTSEDDIIFIEEPENSTHPKALVDLLAFFKSYSHSKQFIISSHSIALLNKSKMEDVIASCVQEDGTSEFFNISSRKDLKARLKQGHINFSDELFFGDFEEESFEL